jgi:hypothetical protein
MEIFVNTLIDKRLKYNTDLRGFKHAACVFTNQHKLPGLWRKPL